MAGGEEKLASAALAVALVALLGTLGQLFQQYFGTADGYRRCQASVVGPWAGRTRLKFRWSQFRFETLFTVPHIMLRRALWVSAETPACPYDDGGWILGRPATDRNASEVNLLVSGNAADTPELVTWLRFLRSLQWTHKKMTLEFGKVRGARFEFDTETNDLKLIEYENRNLSLPIVKFEERSWDFMPPDVVKPFARISVSDLGVLARRLGMEWDRFEPAEGILRAQGNGYSLNSVLVRSVGTMVEFNEILGYGTQNAPLPWSAVIPEHVERKTLLIPCAAADKMAFGILPGVSSDFMHRDFAVHDLASATDLVRYFTNDEALVAAFATGGWQDQRWCPGVSDVLSFVAPMMYSPEVGLFGIPSPDNGFLFHGVTSAGPGESATSLIEPLLKSQAFVEFENQLLQILESDPSAIEQPIRFVYDTVKDLRAGSDQWTTEVDVFSRYFQVASSKPHAARQQPQHAIYTAYRRSTRYFLRNLSQETSYNPKDASKPNFFQIVRYHIRHMFDERIGSEGLLGAAPTTMRIFESPQYPQLSTTTGEPPWAARIEVYFKRLPGLVEEMERDGHGNRDQIRNAWILMIFRGMCWSRCHVLISGKTLPIRYCGSQIPVYLG